MDLLSFFRAKKPPTASVAKDRLMFAVAVQRRDDGRSANPDVVSKLDDLRRELLAVVRKYVQVDDKAMQFNVQKEAGLEVLEMNITLPEGVARLT